MLPLKPSRFRCTTFEDYDAGGCAPRRRRPGPAAAGERARRCFRSNPIQPLLTQSCRRGAWQAPGQLQTAPPKAPQLGTVGTPAHTGDPSQSNPIQPLPTKPAEGRFANCPSKSAATRDGVDASAHWRSKPIQPNPSDLTGGRGQRAGCPEARAGGREQSNPIQANPTKVDLGIQP